MQRCKYIASDLITCAVAFFLFNICRYEIIASTGRSGDSLSEFLFSGKLILEEIIVPVGLVLLFALSGFYNQPFFKSRLGVFVNSFTTALIGGGMIYLIMLLNDIGQRRRDYLVILLLVSFIFLFIYMGRYLINHRFFKKLNTREISCSMLIVGNSAASRRMAAKIRNGEEQVPYDVIGFVRLPGEKDVDDAEKVWNLDEIAGVCQTMHPDQIVIVTEHHSDKRVVDLLDLLIGLDVPVRIAPDTLSYLTSSIRLGDIMGTALVDLAAPRLSEYQKNIKRVLDILLSSLALLLLSPLMAAIALAVRFTSPGPVIYSQSRLGKHQKPFRIYKFRSMRSDAEAEGPRLSHDADPRITRVGHVLRKYRLDELPQFWNVIRGDMSLVGPRPERDFYVRKIMEKAPYYALIFQVRPGITSWGMVKFGYASTVEQMVERSRYDLVYINNMSIWTDVKILIYTIRTVISGAGK